MGESTQRHVSAALLPGNCLGDHFIGGWVETRADRGGCGKEEISFPYRNSSPKLFSLFGVAIQTTLSCPLDISLEINIYFSIRAKTNAETVVTNNSRNEVGSKQEPKTSSVDHKK
jgi:hypothetical protein